MLDTQNTTQYLYLVRIPELVLVPITRQPANENLIMIQILQRYNLTSRGFVEGDVTGNLVLKKRGDESVKHFKETTREKLIETILDFLKKKVLHV